MRARAVFKKLRMKLLLSFRYRDIKAGKDFHVAWNVTIHPPGFQAGDYVYIGPYSEIAPYVRIGNYTSLSSYVCITGHDHLFDKPGVPIIFSGRPESVVTTIGADVLVGQGVTIMRGVTIGNGAIIGSGAVVTRDVPAYAVMVGVPARLVRYRFNEEDQAIHEAMLAKPTGSRVMLGSPR